MGARRCSPVPTLLPGFYVPSMYVCVSPELNCAVASLGVRGFATNSQRSRTVSYEIQILNRSSVASLGVRGLATGSQQVVHRQ